MAHQATGLFKLRALSGRPITPPRVGSCVKPYRRFWWRVILRPEQNRGTTATSPVLDAHKGLPCRRKDFEITF